MRRILAAAGVLVLMSSVCYGQGVAPSFAKGSKAVLFEVNGLNTFVQNVTDGPVFGAGFKYFLSPDNALRFVLNVNKTNTDVTPGIAVVAPNTSIDGYNNTTAFGVAVVLEHHFTMNRVNPYFGGGALFNTSSSETENAVVGNPPPAQTIVKNSAASGAGNAFGVLGVGGVEFFLTNQVSLGAEYQLAFTSTSRKDQESTTGAVTTTIPQGSSKAFGLGVGGSGLMRLAFYF